MRHFPLVMIEASICAGLLLLGACSDRHAQVPATAADEAGAAEIKALHDEGLADAAMGAAAQETGAAGP